MSLILIERITNLNGPIIPDTLNGVLNGSEIDAHKFVITATRDGAAVALTGTVTASFLRADGAEVVLTGEIENSAATVTLAQSCYAVPGRFDLTIFVTADGVKTGVYACTGGVRNTTSGTIVDPGQIVPSVDDIIAKQEELAQDVADASSAIASAQNAVSYLAPVFSTSRTYAVGEYVTKDGALYICTTAVETAGAWDATKWQAVTFGGEVTGLKSAFLNDLGNQFPMLIVKNEYVDNDGDDAGAFKSYNGWDRTELIPVVNYESITVKSSVQSSFNAFYKADKTFLMRFNVTTAGNAIPIPANAAYVAFSNTAAGMTNLSVEVSKKIDKEINDLQSEIQSIKEDVADIDGIITKSETLHDASYATLYSNALNNDYVWIMQKPIPQGRKASVGIMCNSSSYAGALTVVFLQKNENDTYTKLQKVELTTVAGNDFNSVNIPDGITDNSDVYIGFYSVSHGMAYKSSGETETITRFDYADIDDEQITASGEFTLNFSYRLIVYKPNSKNVVYVSTDGSCDYTSVLDAMANEPEGTTIIVEPGVYEQDMTECLKKRVVLIGTDRNQCIIRDTDGRYLHHALYISCGYFENLTIEEPYVSGTSQEVGASDLGAYAVHIDTDGDYSVGKTTEFHHCTIKSDFFPAVGLGMRKDATYIFDDCELTNGQIAGRGDYSDEGTLGALYFHDSNGEQGDQYIKIKDCVLKSNLAYAMCPYQVNRTPQNNRIHCDFINNVLFSDVGKYAGTVWFRNDPFNPSTGIFSIGIGYGNSIASLNNIII